MFNLVKLTFLDNLYKKQEKAKSSHLNKTANAKAVRDEWVNWWRRWHKFKISSIIIFAHHQSPSWSPVRSRARYLLRQDVPLEGGGGRPQRVRHRHRVRRRRAKFNIHWIDIVDKWEFVSIGLEVYCGSRCWCHRWMEGSFQFCLEWRATQKVDQGAEVILRDFTKEKGIWIILNEF